MHSQTSVLCFERKIKINEVAIKPQDRFFSFVKKNDVIYIKHVLSEFDTCYICKCREMTKKVSSLKIQFYLNMFRYEPID